MQELPYQGPSLELLDRLFVANNFELKPQMIIMLKQIVYFEGLLDADPIPLCRFS